MSGVIHQHAAHHVGGHAERVRAIRPLNVFPVHLNPLPLKLLISTSALKSTGAAWRPVAMAVRRLPSALVLLELSPPTMMVPPASS